MYYFESAISQNQFTKKVQLEKVNRVLKRTS